ncbi:MAG: FAD-dependent oxidoreductase [Kiritimatiellaceae bacterium]|nr:FAD-dependent oxidoreductase [Kiritimatiellaceae bacterium]
MPALTINGINVTVDSGATVLAATEKLSIAIPTLCHLKDSRPETSCMLCGVKDLTSGRLILACSTPAADGMNLDTTCAEVQTARRNILNLLLSEHVGDCEAPCKRTCPAHLNTPLMLREILRGNFDSAAWIARRDLAIPVALGYICPSPCEKACRRGQLSTPLTIRRLHRQIVESASSAPDPLTPLGPRKIAVIGSGAAGLSCAWNLRLLGYACTIFDEHPLAGGSLRHETALPSEVLDTELRRLQAAGIEFQLNAIPPAHGFEAVLQPEEHKLAVRAVANGKRTAHTFHHHNRPDQPLFDSKTGKLNDAELRECLKNGESLDSHATSAQIEAQKCLHCDCRKPVQCKLRKYAQQYGADVREFPAETRAPVQLMGHTEDVIFEPGKCIRCGICIKLSARTGHGLGLAFTGRGSKTQVRVPFGETLQKGLHSAAADCVSSCPTGALAFRLGEDH